LHALFVPVELFGIEAQPNTSVVSSIAASFFAGANLVGEIAIDVDGDGGARLFAASSTTPFDKVVLTSIDDFAIAQVRAGIVPEPSSLTMLVLGSVIVATAARKRIGPAVKPAHAGHQRTGDAARRCNQVRRLKEIHDTDDRLIEKRPDDAAARNPWLAAQRSRQDPPLGSLTVIPENG
jgi:hypothetical protein